jgi:hypothetical protein
LLTVASLNTRGIPLTGSQLAERYAAIGAGFDAGDADVVCCQEVLTYWHLRLLVRRMRSFRRVSYWPGPFGPYGGLVTFSRRPVSGTAFRRFGRPPRSPGVPRASRLQARLKGALVTRLARPELCVINTHPVANYDGDWSEANRFYPLHRAQFGVLARDTSPFTGHHAAGRSGRFALPSAICGQRTWRYCPAHACRLRQAGLTCGFGTSAGRKVDWEGSGYQDGPGGWGD